ncbi:SDR family NAD(P)-dependent oxidoreductase [Rubrivivax sp. JA1024]|nr:SDR family NAD(P)-dependent oxidoreductase [Rubrivivax sp. JA1024]
MNMSPPVALVTGSTGGIGACVARALAARGHHLVLMDLDRARLEQQAAAYPGARIETLDLARQDAVLDWAQALQADDAPAIDVAFVNAGLIAVGDVVDLPTEKLLLQLQVNLVSTAIMVQALARHMAAAGHGHLIATVSVGGIVSLKGSAAYSASKFGLRGLLWGLRDELQARGVQVCGIYPAGVDTPMLRHEARHGGSALNFVSQPVTAEDVARAVMAAIDRPRLETYVPATEGITGRLAGAFPGLLSSLYPWLEKMGERGRAAYLARLARDGH